MNKFCSFFTLITLFLFSAPSYGLFGNSDAPLKTEDEKNSVGIFRNTVNSVVFVSTVANVRRSLWDFSGTEVPAGAGTGFLWNGKGHIVTNYHVVKDGTKFLISFHKDKKQYRASIVGVEPKKDIAVLKLDQGPDNLKGIKVGQSKNLLVGQKAVAIGNPFGLDHTMTAGIISALDRKIDGIGGVKIHGMIQTDASINPGNSGGPLLNSSGELIGMNTLIFSGSGTSAGVGFAVPADTVKRIVPQIIKHGKVIRPGLGIGILPDHIKNRFGIEGGIVISYIDEKGAAAKAGLQGMGQDRHGRYYIGDVILEIDGNQVNTFDDIYHVLDKYKIGDKVKITFIREGKKKETKIKLVEL